MSSPDATPVELRVRPLPTDLPGPAARCSIGDPDAEIGVALDLRQWASLLASAVALHSGSEKVVVETRAGDVLALRAYPVDHDRGPREQPAQDTRDDTAAEVLVCDRSVADTDHAVVGQVRSDSLALAMDHGLFSAETRARFAAHVELLAATVDALGACRLPAVTTTRPERTVPRSRDRRAEAEWGECVIGRLLKLAEDNPDGAALVAGERTLSYAALCSWIGGMAERIRGSARCKPVRVGVLARHSPEAVVGVLAALATGSAYVPLDTNLPDGRLRRILRQTGPDVVLHAPELAGRAQLLARTTTRVAIEPCAAMLQAPPSDAAVGSGRMAYVLFTSGTTATPKGVCQTVPGLMRHARVYRDSAGLAAGETVPLLASIAFDAAVMDLYGGLLGGAVVHVVDPLQSASQLREAISSRPPAVLHATPTLLRHLLGDAPAPWPEMAGVRVVVFGGERVTADDVRLVRSVLPGASVINGLGPSECTLAVQHVIAPDDPIDPVIPIGTAVPGVTVSLLGPTGGAADLAGELVFTSPAVAIGYLGQNELTDRHFQVQPDGRRSYRTGDLAWRRPDGALIFVGRADRQLKVRGQRIEPQEIEAVLQSHPTVAQAAVLLDPQGRLVAYVTPATAFRPAPKDVLRFAAKALPGPAVPTRVIAIDRMPIGPTGKRDLSALPEPPSDSGEAPKTFTVHQRRVADIWVRLLRHDRFAADDDFLLVGGDSLLMTELWASLEEEFGATLDFAEVMAQCTVAELSALCSAFSTAGSTGEVTA